MMTLYKKIIAASFLALTPSLTLAAEEGTLKDIVTRNFKSVGDISKLRAGDLTDRLSPIEVFGLYFSTIVGFLAILFLTQVIHGGLLWLMAGGNEEKISTARGKITSSTIGVVIVLSAYFVTAFILNYIGTSLDIEV